MSAADDVFNQALAIGRGAFRTCPLCGGAVGMRTDGTLYPHGRYGAGCGLGPDQPHDIVPCLGEITVRFQRGA